MIGTILLIVLGIFIFYYLFDQNEKSKEVASDKDLNQGLRLKYPNLFHYIIHELEFTLQGEKKTEVRVAKILDRVNIQLNIEIVYQTGNRIQIIFQAYRLRPQKYITTKSYFHSSLIAEEALASAFDRDLEEFLTSII